MAQSDYPELRSIFDKHREVVRMMRAEKKLDGKLIHFKAVYFKLGKKIGENKEVSKINSFANIIIGRYELNEPDSITIIWLQADSESKLYEHTFNISPKKQYQLVEAQTQEVAQTQTAAVFQGLGEVEINQIVERRLTDMRRDEGYEKLKEDYQLVTQKNRELEELNLELEKDKAAKETTESYMRIIGMALPGLSKFFGGASILSMLAGTEDEAKQIETKTEAKGEREEMILLLHDFMQSDLNEQEVAALYMLFMEIQKDKSQIQYLLTQLTKGNSHAQALSK